MSQSENSTLGNTGVETRAGHIEAQRIVDAAAKPLVPDGPTGGSADLGEDPPEPQPRNPDDFGGW